MSQKHFTLRLQFSRPTFAQDMTEEESRIMQEHVLYWKENMAKGIVVIFGPVFDPAGTYGLGIVEVDDEEDVKNLIKNDPATQLHTYVYFPMRAITLHNQ